MIIVNNNRKKAVEEDSWRAWLACVYAVVSKVRLRLRLIRFLDANNGRLRLLFLDYHPSLYYLYVMHLLAILSYCNMIPHEPRVQCQCRQRT